jgi:hypothetical protein
MLTWFPPNHLRHGVLQQILGVGATVSHAHGLTMEAVRAAGSRRARRGLSARRWLCVIGAWPDRDGPTNGSGRGTPTVSLTSSAMWAGNRQRVLSYRRRPDHVAPSVDSGSMKDTIRTLPQWGTQPRSSARVRPTNKAQAVAFVALHVLAGDVIAVSVSAVLAQTRLPGGDPVLVGGAL